MNILLKEIRDYKSDAAKVLQRADFCSDSEIQSLTREDLHELFPGAEKLKLRRKIFEIINKQKPVEKLLQDLRGFIPEDSIKDALSSNGVLVDYLRLLKDMKAQLNHVQSFIDAHVGLLEDIKAQPQQKHDPGPPAKTLDTPRKTVDTPTRTLDTQITSRNLSNDTPTQKSHVTGDQSARYSMPSRSGNYGAQVMGFKYRTVISGQTFNAHNQILENLKSSPHHLNLVESQNSEDCQIVFVFCPISSRTGTDVDAAMKMVTDDKPVILVLMHHAHEAKHVTPMGTWDHNPKIVQHVNVFYHETTRGLLDCKENNGAISTIGTELRKHGAKAEPGEYSASTGGLYRAFSLGNNDRTGHHIENKSYFPLNLFSKS
ncbi:uncharacterized protein LOC105919207 [Fundulus heteroclitus]|uniref:uncharacterized protein LOC105919207 n=1 Tax=Fundulus heteroclitus TaxID=8078 RepID=UPI00165CB762|nr:uncharacterized protein LOC105919207 [Fundulus heteroclitus]XP_036003457.1 uncharacterized protein LOC105919207 [Fundulus heteroclitus]